MEVREVIRRSIEAALETSGIGAEGTPVVLARPKEAAHGDISTPVAMALAKQLGKNPLEIAEQIVDALDLPSDAVTSVETVKPGFINFRFADAALRSNLTDVIAAGDAYGCSDLGGGARILVEYVSANPTGPLVVVSARAAAIGSAIVNLLRCAGFDVESEYYVNDYGGQVKALAESFKYRLRERFGLLREGEEIGAYPGEYLREIAERIPENLGRRMLETPGTDDGKTRGEAPDAETYVVDAILEMINRDLDAFGVTFNNQFRESTLHPDAVSETLDVFIDRGVTYEADGATYFRSAELGDDKDRVLRKSDGSPTYFVADIAYHRNKLERGYAKSIDLLGPDHHGHVARMKAAMSVSGANPDWLEVLTVGWVRLMEDGKPTSMSKRKGEFVTLEELMNDVGSDVARYFFLMRRTNAPLDFDLSLARKQSEENPVFYVQYAHARISSVIRFAEENGYEYAVEQTDLSLLSSEAERDLMVDILYFPHVVEGAAVSMEPHRLTAYAQDLATAFHRFYHECRIVSDDRELSSARLLLADATRQVLKNALRLLGVSAPASM